jgi:hypothetical protein
VWNTGLRRPRSYVLDDSHDFSPPFRIAPDDPLAKRVRLFGPEPPRHGLEVSESLRHHSDHSVASLIEGYVAPYHVRVTVEMPLPQIVA